MSITKLQLEKMDCKTNHVLHLILSLLTGGLWIIIWIIVSSNNSAKIRKLDKLIEENERMR